MRHLLQTRKAAQSITAAMRYFLAKQRYLRSMKECEDNDNGNGSRLTVNTTSRPTEIEDNYMIVDRVEIGDMHRYKREMLYVLRDFTTHCKELRQLNLHQ